MSFAKRGLRYSFQLGTGGLVLPGSTPETFDSGQSTLVVQDVRSVASLLGVQGGATPFVSRAQIQIWGMNPSDMAKLSTLGLDIARINKNSLQVSAYNEKQPSSLVQVFTGTISNARLNYNAMPDVSLELECYGTYSLQTQSIAGTSKPGTTDVATMLQGICSTCTPPLTLVNSVVTSKLANPALSGSAFDQIQEICSAAGILYHIDGTVLTIYPSGTNPDGVVITTGPDMGMVGYPEYNMMGFDITTEFDPQIQLSRQLKLVASSSGNALPVPGIPGTYSIWGVEHELSSQMPDGPWFTHARVAATGSYPHS